MSEGFRSEVIENQKARIDLVKWKLLIIAGIFAWSFDQAAKGFRPLSFWAISLVPFVCLFVDSQSFHINLRTFVIGQFLSLHERNTEQSEYEQFVHWLRTNKRRMDIAPTGLGRLFWHVVQLLRGDIFQLEQGVLTWSTLALCAGVFLWPNLAHAFSVNQAVSATPAELACRFSGLVGLLLSGVLLARYEALKSKLTQDAKQYKGRTESTARR